MRRPPKVFLALVIAILAASLPMAVALAQEELPQLPNTFFGDATDNNGQPAPVGVVVTAVVDRGVAGSEKRYSLVVTEAGKFGSRNGLRLKVGGDLQGEIADGSVIQFFLSVGKLREDISGLAPVAESSFADDGENAHDTSLQLAGPIQERIQDPSDTPPPVPPDSSSIPDQPRRDDDDDNGSSPIPTSTPPPATPTSPSNGGGGGQPVPQATAQPEEPTPVIVVVAPPQVPTPTEVPSITNVPTQTTEATPTQQQPAATPDAPTPTTSLEIDETLTGGGGEGGFPWWGWVIIVLGAGAVATGVALYYLRT